MKKYLLLTCALLISVPAYATTDELIGNVKSKNLTAVENLLNNGENVNAANAQGNTALHYAVATNNKDMVKLLLQHNADMNAKNEKGWSPLSIAEKKNVGEIYGIFENKIAVEETAAKAAELKAKQAAEAKAAAEKIAKEKADAEARAKAMAEAKAAELKAKQEAEAKAAAEKTALAQKSADVKKAETKVVNIPLKKNTAKTTPTPAKAKPAKSVAKQTFKASKLSSKVNQGQEEVVYCLQYLGLQGEQKNMTVAAEYYAAENGVNKTRYDTVAQEAEKYYENASEADIKTRADLCGKYITPKNAAAQNKIIRSINRSIGF